MHSNSSSSSTMNPSHHGHPAQSSGSASAAAAQPANAKITQIGPYRLGKTLGIGSFSKVKLATHQPTQQKVAIKILNRRKLRRLDMGEKVRTEIHILRLFTHPHIIRLYEVIDTPTDIFTVMEYVPGGELFDYIVSRGKLDELEARTLFQQIISGIEYCHVHGVVHRDLKPENLLLDADNKIKLADFGLANRLKDGQFLKTSCGSPNYAAPEVISGNLYAGPEVDVWSCGVILYALLCGSLPFDDENIRSLFKKIKGGHYTIPPSVSQGARDLITKMLAIDPLRRIKVPEIMRHPWYLQSLPAYLSLSAEQIIEKQNHIDETIMQKVVAMGYQREKVLRALAMGYELLTSRKLAHHVDAKRVAVIYNLLRDQKRRREQQREEITQDLKAFANNKENNQLLVNRQPTMTDPPIDFASMSRVAGTTYRRLNEMQVMGIHHAHLHHHPQHHQQQPHYTPMTPAHWQLGVWSRDDPLRLMSSLYSLLKTMNFDWKVLSLFKIKARYPANLIDSQNRVVHSNEVCKIGIQLYKDPNASALNDSNGKGGGDGVIHFLDVTKLYGQMFLFLELVNRLLTQLATQCNIR